MSDDLRSDGPVDELTSAGGRLTDPGWLVHGDPEQVLAASDGAAGRRESSAAAVYRASGHVHRDAGALVRRQVLALDAARYGDRELARDIAEVPVGQEADDAWVVRWATGSGLDARLRYALPAPAEVGAVATVVVADRGLAVAGCKDGTLRWWDLTTGRDLGKVVTGHTGYTGVSALTAAVLDGRPVAVTSGYEGTIRVWDLAGGELAGSLRVGDDSWVHLLAAQQFEGRPVVVGGSTDGLVRMWDPAALTRRGELLSIRTGGVSALATAVLDGRPVAVTGHSHGTVRAWDLVTGQELGARSDPAEEPPAATDQASAQPMAESGDDDGGMRRCATLELNAMTHVLATDPASECALAVSADAYEVRILDLAAGEEVGEPVPAGFVETAAVRTLHGRPAALVGHAGRGPVEVWDLSARRHLCLPLVGHEGTVRAVATAVAQGRHLAVTGGDDGAVRIWDLDAAGETDSRPAGPARPVQRFTTAVVDGRCVVVTADLDGVRIRDLDDGEQLGEPLTGQSGVVDLLTVGVVDGAPTLITRDRHETVRMWDLTTREQLHGRSTTEHTSPSIQFFAALEGRFVAVTHTARVWDLTTSAWLGVQPRQDGARVLAVERLAGRNVVLTGSPSHAVCLWDLTTGEPLGPPMTGHTGDVRAGAAGMLDGRVVVAAGGDDGTVRVWDALTGRQSGAYAFPARVRGLAVAPDGRLVVGFGSDIAVLTHR